MYYNLPFEDTEKSNSLFLPLPLKLIWKTQFCVFQISFKKAETKFAALCKKNLKVSITLGPYECLYRIIAHTNYKLGQKMLIRIECAKFSQVSLAQFK